MYYDLFCIPGFLVNKLVKDVSTNSRLNNTLFIMGARQFRTRTNTFTLQCVEVRNERTHRAILLKSCRRDVFPVYVHRVIVRVTACRKLIVTDLDLLLLSLLLFKSVVLDHFRDRDANGFHRKSIATHTVLPFTG